MLGVQKHFTHTPSATTFATRTPVQQPTKPALPSAAGRFDMGDSRRGQRPDSRQMWDESDRRDRLRDRDSDSRRGRGYRSRSRDRRGPPRDRSRSPERRYRDREDDYRPRERDSGRDRDRGGPRRYDGRDRRRDDDRDHRGQNRDGRSRSPPTHASTSALPTRSRPEAKEPRTQSREGHVGKARGQSRDGGRMDEDEDSGNYGEGGNEEEPDDDAAAMQAMLGFGGFGTTKGKKVAGNNAGGVQKEKKTEYRQYMNRQGGFNRPLSPSR